MQTENPLPNNDFLIRLAASFGLIILLVIIDTVTSLSNDFNLLHMLFSGAILIAACVGLWIVLRKFLQNLALFAEDPAIEKARQAGLNKHSTTSEKNQNTDSD